MVDCSHTSAALQVLAEAAQQQVFGDQLAAQARLADQRQQAEQVLVPRRHHAPDTVHGLETAAESENLGGHDVGRDHVGAIAEGAQPFRQAGHVFMDVPCLAGGAVLMGHQAGKHGRRRRQGPAAAGARLVEAHGARRRVGQAMIVVGVNRIPPQAVGHQQYDVPGSVHACFPRHAESETSVCEPAPARHRVCSSPPCAAKPNRPSGENTRAKSSGRKTTANLRACSSRRRR